MAAEEHVVKIKVTADTQGGDAAAQSLEKVGRAAKNAGADGTASVGALKSAFIGFRAVVLSVSKVVFTFTRALGIIGLAVNAATMLYEVFKRLKAKIEEVRTAAARMRWAAEMAEAADATKRLVGYHERLSRLMKEESDALSKQKSLREMRQQAEDDAEDGKREADRARLLYEADTPEEEQRLRDRFAAEDERIAKERKARDTKNRIRDLDEEESVYASKANGLRANNEAIDRQIAERRFDRSRATNDEDRATIDGQIESLKKQKEANELTIKTYETEAKFRRDQIAILEGRMQAERGGEPPAGEWNRKREQRKRDNQAAKEAQAAEAAQAEHAAKLKKAEEADKRRRIDKGGDDAERLSNLRLRETLAKDRFDKAEDAIRAEEAKPAKDQDRDKLSRLRGESETAQGEMFDFGEQARALERDMVERRRGELEGQIERAAAVDGVSQNRLTAMGLGSGVSASGGVASDVHKMLDLLREQIKATKDNKPVAVDTTATFAD